MTSAAAASLVLVMPERHTECKASNAMISSVRVSLLLVRGRFDGAAGGMGNVFAKAFPYLDKQRIRYVNGPDWRRDYNVLLLIARVKAFDEFVFYL
jgi:hypothetical protein